MKITLPWAVHAEIAETCTTPEEKAAAYDRIRRFYAGIAEWPGPYRVPTTQGGEHD